MITVGEHLLYTPGALPNQFGKQPKITVELGWATRFANYDYDLNRFIVEGMKVTDADIGDWQIRVIAEYSDESGQKSQRFENSFTLTILPDPLSIKKEEEEVKEIDPSKTV